MSSETVIRPKIKEKRRVNKAETPQIRIRYFRFFVDQAFEILRLKQRQSVNDYSDFDSDNESISFLIPILELLASQIANIRDKDPNLNWESSDEVVGRFLRRFQINANKKGLDVISDGIIRTAIVLKSIVYEATKNNSDPEWLYDQLDGYLTDKAETLRLMQESLDYIPPSTEEFPKEDRTYIQALAYIYHLEYKKQAMLDAQFACKMVPKWAIFLARSPLFTYDR